MCFLTRHFCTGCKFTHDELVRDPCAKQPEVLWSKVCSGKMKVCEVYDDPETCLLCYEKEYKALEVIFAAREKRKLRKAKAYTKGQIEVLKEGLRVQFHMEVGILRQEFSPFGG